MLEKIYDFQADVLLCMLTSHDAETGEHACHVAALTLELARAYGIPKREYPRIWRGALLHDIGKIAIPRRILRKKGELTNSERAVINRHPAYARNFLYAMPGLRQIVPIPYCHHEKWNGSGYPRRLKERQIPLEARLFAVVDVWDALTSDRPYRPAWSRQQAGDYIHEHSGKHFDPRVVHVFLDMLSGRIIPFTKTPTKPFRGMNVLNCIRRLQ